MEAKDRIIVALDVDDVEEATALVGKLRAFVGGFEIRMELLAAMLLSVFTPEYPAQVHLRLLKINELFSLFGCNALQALQLVRETKGAGCEGLIFSQGKIILIGKDGEHLRNVTPEGGMVETGLGFYVRFGSKITQAIDPVEAAKNAAKTNQVTMLQMVFGDENSLSQPPSPISAAKKILAEEMLKQDCEFGDQEKVWL